MKIIKIRTQRAIKTHICNDCKMPIESGQNYQVIVAKDNHKFIHERKHLFGYCKNIPVNTVTPELRETIKEKLGSGEPGFVSRACDSIYTNEFKKFEEFRKNLILESVNGRTTAENPDFKDYSSPVLPSFIIECQAFTEFLRSLYEFHRRWNVAIINTAEDRKALMLEEVAELYSAIEKMDLKNIEEELADIVAIAFGNILWMMKNKPTVTYETCTDLPTFSIYSILQSASQKLNYRARFGYQLRGIFTGKNKVTHYKKVVDCLTKNRDAWEVVLGPKHIHPEVRELLTFKEIEKLEKTGY